MAMPTSAKTTQLQCMQLGGPFRTIDAQASLNLAPREILVHQKVIALNPIDTKRRDFGIAVQEWPVVLGLEGGGVVEGLGEDVQDFKVGDEVVGWENNAFQQRVTVSDHMLMKKPSNLSLEEAASTPVCFITAAAILADLKIPVPSLSSLPNKGSQPTSVLVLGGASVVGSNVVQILRMTYPSLPIVATASTKNHTHVVKMGASTVVDYRSPSLIQDIKKALPNGAGVDVIIDCVSAGADATSICDVFDAEGSKRYSSLRTGREQFPVPQDVVKTIASAETLLGGPEMQGLLRSFGRLIEDGKYRLPVPVTIVGHGLDAVPSCLDGVMKASCEKQVVTL